MTGDGSLFGAMQANLAASPIRLFFYVFCGGAVTALAERNRPLRRPLYMRALCWMMASFPIALIAALIRPWLCVAAVGLIVVGLVFMVNSYRAGEIRRS